MIRQNARAILDAIKVYNELEQQGNTEERREKMRRYILSLTKSIERSVDEERRNLG